MCVFFSFFFLFHSLLAKKKKTGAGFKLHLRPQPPPARSKQLPSKAIRFSETGRCDGQLIKGGFVRRRSPFCNLRTPESSGQGPDWSERAALLLLLLQPWRTHSENWVPSDSLQTLTRPSARTVLTLIWLCFLRSNLKSNCTQCILRQTRNNPYCARVDMRKEKHHWCVCVCVCVRTCISFAAKPVWHRLALV